MNRERGATPRADRLTIARALREMAGLLEVSGQEPFKARAYSRGAEEVLNTRAAAEFARSVAPASRT